MKNHYLVPAILLVILSAVSTIPIQAVASQDSLDGETRNELLLDRNLWTIKSNYRLFPKKKVASVDNDDYTATKDNGLLAAEEIPSHEIPSSPLFPGWTVKKDDAVDAEERDHKDTTNRDQDEGHADSMIEIDDEIVEDEELADWFNYTRSDCIEPVVTNSRRQFLRRRNLESKGHKSSKAGDEDHSTKSKSGKSGSKASKSYKSGKSSVKCTDPPKEMDTQMPSMKPSEETSIIPVNEKKMNSRFFLILIWKLIHHHHHLYLLFH